MICPTCGSEHIVKNGSIHNKKPKFMCKTCKKQFVEAPSNQRISTETKSLIDKLLLERLSLAGIVRVTGVSEKWLNDYIKQKYAETPRKVNISSKKKLV